MMISKIVKDFLEWLPLKDRIRCIDQLSQKFIEENFHDLPVTISDIFYIKTWSPDFLEHNLLPEHVEFWDHISTWYSLTETFCERNVEWLNFYELFYSQTLPKKFYLRHVDRIDWVPAAKLAKIHAWLQN